MKIDRQCMFRFVITNQYIDEITCKVVPLDICQVILGNPYLWDKDAVYFRRAQKYQLEKDEKRYIVHKNQTHRMVELVTACQARRMVNASQKFVLLMIRSKHREGTTTAITLTCS